MLYIMHLLQHQFFHFRIKKSLTQYQINQNFRILHMFENLSFVFEPSLKHSVTRKRRKLKRFIKRSVGVNFFREKNLLEANFNLNLFRLFILFFQFIYSVYLLELSRSFENFVVILDLPLLTLVESTPI